MAITPKPRVENLDSTLGQSLTKPLKKAPKTSPMFGKTIEESSVQELKKQASASRKNARVVQSVGRAGKRSLSVMINEDTWGRVHSAYLLEKIHGADRADGSFGRWVEKIMEEIVTQTEQAYNNGETLNALQSPLPTGRK